MAEIIDGGFPDSTYDEAPTVGAYSPATRTVADVLRSVKRTFGDEAGVQLEDADILGWINDAQVAINNENRILKSRSTVGAIPGQATYRFPLENIRQVEAVHYDGSRVPNMSFEEAQAHIIGVDTSWGGTVPQFWYEWAGTFTFWPAPPDNKQIDLYCTLSPRPATLNAGETLSVPDKYFKQVVDYVLAQAYEMDEDWQGAQAKATQFSEAVNKMGEEERSAQSMTYSTISVIDI